MLRKLFGVLVVASAFILMSGATEAMGQGIYELGPYTVYGIGDNEEQSQTNAMLEMNDKIAEVAATLPANHFIIATPIDDEYQWMSTIYVIEFRIVVMAGFPPGGPGGGIL